MAGHLEYMERGVAKGYGVTLVECVLRQYGVHFTLVFYPENGESGADAADPGHILVIGPGLDSVGLFYKIVSEYVVKMKVGV